MSGFTDDSSNNSGSRGEARYAYIDNEVSLGLHKAIHQRYRPSENNSCDARGSRERTQRDIRGRSPSRSPKIKQRLRSRSPVSPSCYGGTNGRESSKSFN